MSQGPTPLPQGTILAGRYEIVRTLGQGGFGITYLAHDAERQADCAVKEMAPAELERKDNGEVDWRSLGPSASQRLRHQFVREASTLRKLRIPGIPTVRDWFHENGTAYIVSEYVAGARTLESVLIQGGRMSVEETVEILDKLCAILEPLHRHGIIHRDLKPSNILLGPDGMVYLIDFGSAREWHVGHTQHHTIQYTPGFAPIEQMSEKGKRGPATDLYGMCATAWTTLTGSPPPASTDRAAGEPLPDLRSLRGDVPLALATAVTRALSVDYHQRPANVDQFREMLNEFVEVGEEGSLAELDARMLRLQKFRFAKRACPACDGPLEPTRPLAAGVCPVCREGKLLQRKLDPHLCPHCRTGRLRRREYRGGVPWSCPVCLSGTLSAPTVLPWQKRTFQCSNCPAKFPAQGGKVWAGTDEIETTWEELVESSGRSSITDICDGCGAQYDLCDDQRWLQVHPKPGSGKPDRLYAEEWELVAAGLDPSQGNGVCSACAADFHLEPGSVTLLRSSTDAFAFADEFTGVLLTREGVRWAGAGKISGNPGLTCVQCHTEFDFAGADLLLVRTQHRRLRKLVGDEDSLANWHRLADNLPRVGEEHDLEDTLLHSIREAYCRGEIGVDPRDPGTTWKGSATNDAGRSASFTVDSSDIVFGSFLAKERFALASIRDMRAEEDELKIVFNDRSPLNFLVEPAVLEARLSSGRYSITLTAEDLCARLGFDH